MININTYIKNETKHEHRYCKLKKTCAKALNSKQNTSTYIKNETKHENRC